MSETISLTKSGKAEIKVEPKPEIYVLTRNYGSVFYGKHSFWPKGTEFTPEKDLALIEALFKSGAPIKLKD